MSAGFEIEINTYSLRLRIHLIGDASPSSTPPSSWRAIPECIIGPDDDAEEAALQSIFQFYGLPSPRHHAYGLKLFNIVSLKTQNVHMLSEDPSPQTKWKGDIKIEHGRHRSFGEILIFEFASAPSHMREDSRYPNAEGALDGIGMTRCDALYYFLNILHQIAPLKDGWRRLNLKGHPYTQYKTHLFTFTGSDNNLIQPPEYDEFTITLPLDSDPNTFVWMRGHIEYKPIGRVVEGEQLIPLTLRHHVLADREVVEESVGLQMTISTADTSWIPDFRNHHAAQMINVFSGLQSAGSGNDFRSVGNLEKYNRILRCTALWNLPIQYQYLIEKHHNWHGFAALSLVRLIIASLASKAPPTDADQHTTPKNCFPVLPKTSVQNFIRTRFWDSEIEIANKYAFLQECAREFVQELKQFPNIFNTSNIIGNMLSMRERERLFARNTLPTGLREWWNQLGEASIYWLFIGVMLCPLLGATDIATFVHDAMLKDVFNRFFFVNWIEFCEESLPAEVVPEDTPLGRGSMKVELRVFESRPLTLHNLPDLFMYLAPQLSLLSRIPAVLSEDSSSSSSSSMGVADISRTHSAAPSIERHNRWIADTSSITECPSCHRHFTILTHRHHCYKCGRIFCDQCAPLRTLSYAILDGFFRQQRDKSVRWESYADLQAGSRVRMCNPCWTHIAHG